MTLNPGALLVLLAYAGAGAALAAVYFGALRRNVDAYCGGGPVAMALAAHVLRLAGAVAVFAAIAAQGAAPVLAALAGFTVIRIAAVRAAKAA